MSEAKDIQKEAKRIIDFIEENGAIGYPVIECYQALKRFQALFQPPAVTVVLDIELISALSTVIGVAGAYPDDQSDSKFVRKATDVIQKRLLDALEGKVTA